MELKRADLLRRLAPGLAVAASLAIFRLAASPTAVSGTAHALVIVALVVAAVVLVWIPGIAVASATAGKVPESLLPAVTACGAAGAGWLLFWAWFANPGVGRVATFGCAAISSIALALRPRGTLRAPALAAPLLLALLIAVGYVALAGDHGNIAGGADMIAPRYWVVVDNKIPEFFADGLIYHRHGLNPMLIGDWRSSDRPPLQAGMMMTAYPIASTDGRLLGAFVLGVAANMLWVLGLWSVLRCLRFRASTTALVVLAISLAGPVFVNIVFTWPKMLAGGLTLCALSAVLNRELAAGRRVILGGAAAALALLAHGGALPAVLAVALLVVMRRYRLKARTLALTGLVAIAVYSPWIGYQHFYNPPGNRLLKWHLAGNTKLTNESALRTIARAYEKAGIGGTLHNKLDNVRAIVGDPTFSNGSHDGGHLGWTGSRIGRLRILSLTRIGLAPGLLLLGLLAFARRRVRRSPWAPPLAVFFALSTLIYALMEFGGGVASLAWMHTSPYASLLVLFALGAAAISELGARWLWGLVLAQLVSFLALWVVHVNLRSAFGDADTSHLDISLAVVAGAAFSGAAILALALDREHRAPARHAGVLE